MIKAEHCSVRGVKMGEPRTWYWSVCCMVIPAPQLKGWVRALWVDNLIWGLERLAI